jgi:hypothetical protein
MRNALVFAALLCGASVAHAEDQDKIPKQEEDQPLPHKQEATDSAPAPTTTPPVAQQAERPAAQPSTTSTEQPAAQPSSTSTSVQQQLEIHPGRHKLSAHIGYQAGFGGDFGSPSGLKLTVDYGYRFHRLAWFVLQVGNTFGFGDKDGLCVGSTSSSCYRGGWDASIAAGARLQFTMRVPVVIEVPILLGVEILYNRNCGDNGAAFPVFRPGLRAKYFVHPRVGIGAGLNFAFGASHHGSGDPVCSTNGYTDFYGAFDFSLGTEVIL